MGQFRPVRSKMSTAVIGTVLGLALAACSSSSPKAAQPSASTPPAVSGKTGQVATGAPILVGYANLQGSTQGVNLPTNSQAAQAAVAYINHHGGIQGRPLKLTVCDLLTTPASDVACANSLAAAGPAAILEGAVDNADPIVSAAAAAGIPFVDTSDSSLLELTSPDAFGLTPGDTIGIYRAVAANEQKLGGKKVAIVFIAAGSGAAAAAQSAAAPAFRAFGISESVVLVPPGEADLAPTVQAATASGTTGVLLNTDAPTCLAALNAKATVGISSSIRFYANSSCDVSSVLKGAGANANGFYISDVVDPANKKDPDVAVYMSAMSTYAPGVNPLGYAPPGFATVMDLYNAMKTIPAGTAITAASVKAALQTAKNVPLFMADGATFTCDHSVFKAEPAICGNTSFLEQYTSSGGLQYVGDYKVPAGS